MQNVSMKGAKWMLTVNLEGFIIILIILGWIYSWQFYCMWDVNANANMKGAKQMLTVKFGRN